MPAVRYSVLRVYTSEKRSIADKVMQMAGVDDGEDPPVPIPNTEVKLTCAEDSWLKRPVKIGRCRLLLKTAASGPSLRPGPEIAL